MQSLAEQALCIWDVLFALIMTPLLLVIYTGMFAAAAVWAPFGALVCSLIAWRRGLSPYRYAVAGAVYSALFFLPWVYLAARMLGWVVPKPLAALPYVVLYAAWLQGPAQFNYELWAYEEAYRSAWRFAWLANMLTMIVSLLLMTPIEKINPLYRRARRCGTMRDALPNPVYLLPFALLWGWTVALFALSALSGN